MPGIRLPSPGVQLGFGFAASGIGGLVGINRRVDLDPLSARLQRGAGDVLFASDPVKDAPKLLGDMDAILPAVPGSYVFGRRCGSTGRSFCTSMWACSSNCPRPSSSSPARLTMGVEQLAIVRLRLDFVGGVDPTASLIFFDGR